ncbi:hypothetical protein ACVWWO_000251 [Bradyrhizobium sp. F1.13.1]
MAGHEDNGNINVRLGQFTLEVQTAHSWQPNVEDQAAGDIWKRALQHFGCRTEYLNLQSDRCKEIAERFTHQFIVFDN